MECLLCTRKASVKSDRMSADLPSTSHPELVSGSTAPTGRSKTAPTKKQPVVWTTNKNFGENPNIGSDGETRPTYRGGILKIFKLPGFMGEVLHGLLHPPIWGTSSSWLVVPLPPNEGRKL